MQQAAVPVDGVWPFEEEQSPVTCSTQKAKRNTPDTAISTSFRSSIGKMDKTKHPMLPSTSLRATVWYKQDSCSPYLLVLSEIPW